MGDIQRIHCHSAFKHYEMFHCKESSFGNSIFNTTYNFNGGIMCGGGFWGGLWGGLGMGLGAGLMNFLGGGLFGGGFGMFGGGMGLMGGYSPFGLFNRTPVIDGAGGQDKNVKRKEKEKECNDPDRGEYNKLDDKLIALEQKYLEDKKSVTAKEIADLKKAIEDARDKCDKSHENDDEKSFENLLTRLNLIKSSDDGDGNKTVTTAGSTNGNSNDAKTNANEAAKNTEKTDNIAKANEAAKKAEKTNNTAKANETAKIALHFAKHDKPDMIDKTIEGSLLGIKTDGKGNLKYYIIECDTEDSKLKLRYKVTYNGKNNSDEDIYLVECLNKSHKNNKYKGTQDAPNKLYRKTDGIEYKLKNGVLVTDSDDTVVSTKKRNGYEEITFKKNGELDEANDYLAMGELDDIETYSTDESENGFDIKFNNESETKELNDDEKEEEE